MTLAYEVSGGDEALVGDMTGNLDVELLRKTYRQEDLQRLLAHSMGLGRVLRKRDPGA